MKKTWIVWVLLIGAIAGILFAYNRQSAQNSVSLSEIFPEDQTLPTDVDYEFVDGAQVQDSAQTIITQGQQQAAAQGTAAKTAITTATTAAKSTIASPSASLQTAKVAPTTVTTTAAAPLAQADFSKIPFTIQVASFKEKAKADKILAEAKAKNFPAYLASKNVNNATWYRIYIGEFKTKSEADQYLTQVQGTYQGSFVIAPK